MAASPLAMGEERRISNRPNKWTPDPYIAPNATTRFDPFLAQDGLIRLPRSSKNLPTSGVSDVWRILFVRGWSRCERQPILDLLPNVLTHDPSIGPRHRYEREAKIPQAR